LKFVVSGGAGFIGSNLVRAIVYDGYDVVVIDNLHTGSRDNLSSVPHQFIYGSAREIFKVDNRPHGIFYLGMPSSSPMYRENRRLIGGVIEDAISVFEYALKHKCRVVIASTSSVYNGNPLPWREDMKIYPKDFYSEVRYYIERLAETYRQLYNLDYVVLRLFSVYGPREEYKGKFANVITQMIWAKILNEEFVIYGDGTQTRDFIHVNDVVEAFRRAMEIEEAHGVYNVGTGIETSFKEVANIIGVKVRYVKNPIRNYVYRTRADTRKAENELKFKAKIPLTNGIKRTQEYYEGLKYRLKYIIRG